jgi:hypothetical protein
VNGDRPFEAAEDPRLLEILRTLRQQRPDSPYGHAEDRHRTVLLNGIDAEKKSPLKIGMIRQSLPFLNAYTISLGTHGVVSGCAGMDSGTSGPGARTLNRYPAGTSVLVWHEPRLPFAYILCAVPTPASDPRYNLPPALLLAGGYSAKTESYLDHLLNNLAGGGGVADFNAGRPLDDTALDKGFVAETGVGLYANSFEAVLAAAEDCGVFANLLDHHLRIHGRNLDEFWEGGERSHRVDNGELSVFEGLAFYPWEAAGLYAPGKPYTENSAEDCQRYAKKTPLDLAPDEMDRMRFYRTQRHAGFIARGVSNFVLAPPRRAGKRAYKDEDADVGLLHEHQGLDGDWSVTAAGRIVLRKTPRIVVPRRRKLAEDMDGDDKDYKYSGLGDASHNEKPITLDPDRPDLHLDVAAETIADVAAGRTYAGYAKHAKDFQVKPPAQVSREDGVLDFAALAAGGRLKIPDQVQIDVDDVTGAVKLFLASAYIALEPNGDVRLASGGGAAIVLSGGDIRLECPGDLLKHVGRSEIGVCGRDHIVKANNSVDVTTTKNNISLKAQRTLMFMAGNDDKGDGKGDGGMVFECRSGGKGHAYKDRRGETVGASGVVFKVPNSEFAVLSADVYLRVGDHAKLKDGAITLDAGRGQNPIYLYGKSLDAYVNNSVGFWFGAQEESSDVTRGHLFTKQTVSLQGTTLIDGVIVASDSAVFGGSVVAAGSIAAGGKLADSSGGFVGKTTAAGQIASYIVSSATDDQADIVDAAATVHEFFVTRYYGDAAIGGDDLVEALGFSFRDDQDQGQYLSKNLKIAEPRWQTLERFGGAKGLYAWNERPLRYQGEALYPYPGKKAWTEDETLARLSDSPLRDFAEGTAKTPDADAISDYLDGAIGSLEFAVPSEAYKTLFQEG